jgi:hypothetical protein
VIKARRKSRAPQEGSELTSDTGRPVDVPAVRVVDELRSWKDIAVFIHRDQRTAMRWAKERGMPIRRVPGGARGRVYGSRAEISAWMASGQSEDHEGTIDEETSAKSGPRKYLIAAILVLVVLGTGAIIFLSNFPKTTLARLAFSSDSLSALTTRGRVLWTHKFAGALAPETLDGGTLEDMARIIDLYSDGRHEVIVAVPIRSGLNPHDSVWGEVDCFSESGALLWSYIPRQTFTFGELTLDGPWYVLDVLVTQHGNRHAIYAAFNHASWGLLCRRDRPNKWSRCRPVRQYGHDAHIGRTADLDRHVLARRRLQQRARQRIPGGR